VAHSTNKAAIAAGVVVGLLAFIALAGGGAYLYMRRRKIRQVEEEYRRNAAVSEFVAGGKTHGSSNGSFSDTRLDPTVMAQRRMSDGSIADNQDYSRRILKVCSTGAGGNATTEGLTAMQVTNA
jgi:cell wall integrity and stress response component